MECSWIRKTCGMQDRRRERERVKSRDGREMGIELNCSDLSNFPLPPLVGHADTACHMSTLPCHRYRAKVDKHQLSTGLSPHVRGDARTHPGLLSSLSP